MTRVLITGATGFIGSHLAETLVQRGDSVRCLVRRSSSLEHLRRVGVQLACGDLASPGALDDALEGIDLVYHLAGKTAALRTSELYEVNGRGTERLVEACARQPRPPRLLVVSSLAAAGTARADRLREPNDPPRPVSHYGRSKLAGERAAEAWAGRVPTTIVRPGIVFGPRDRDVLTMFQCVYRYRFYVAPTYARYRVSLIHVSDLVEILLRAAEHAARLPARRGAGEGGRYLAVAPEYPTYAQLGRMLARALGTRPPLLVHMVEPMLWLIGGANQLRSRLRGRPEALSIDKVRETLAGNWIASAEGVQRQLGYTPPLSLAQRLRETADWYRRHDWL